MIVKERDASKAKIAYLERLELVENNTDTRSNIRHARARLRSNTTTDHACSVIDGMFSASAQWMVLHDLRLSIGRQVFHVNHLLINDAMEFYVIDSRYIQYGLTLTDSGAWQAQNNQGGSVIASPLNKLSRDVRFLRTHLKSMDILPKYFGVSRPGIVKGYVLVNPAIRCGKPRTCETDTSMVVSPDGLFHTVWQEPAGHWLNKRLKPESADSLQVIARKLEGLHESTMPAYLASCYARDHAHTHDYIQDTSHCSDCGAGVCESVREQCFRNAETFKSKMLCIPCQRHYMDQTAVFASF